MTSVHTLLFRLVGPMQSWGYRSRFEDRDTGLEPTRSAVLGLLASAAAVPRSDKNTLQRWDGQLRFGVRLDLPTVRNRDLTGFRVETDWHTAQDVLRATGKGKADTVLSHRHYLADARFTIGLEASDLRLLSEIEDSLKDPYWSLYLGRKSFPLALPPWLPGGGVRENFGLLEALKSAPFPVLTPNERVPSSLLFRMEPGQDVPVESIAMRIPDRPLDFVARQYGLRETRLFRLSTAECSAKEDKCFSLR